MDCVDIKDKTVCEMSKYLLDFIDNYRFAGDSSSTIVDGLVTILESFRTKPQWGLEVIRKQNELMEANNVGR